MGKSSPSPPAAPDPVATAAAQSTYNKEAALYQSSLNNVNQITPYGNISYTLNNGGGGGSSAPAATPTATAPSSGGGSPLTYQQWMAQNPNTPMMGRMSAYNNYRSSYSPSSSGGSTAPAATPSPSTSGLPQWTSNITLSPAEQKIFDEQMSNQQQAGQLAGGALGQYQSAASSPMDYSKFTAIPSMGDLGGAEQRAMQAQMDLINPSLQQQDDALQTRMMNQGLSPGSEAWNNSYREFNGLKAQTMDNATLNAQQFATGDLNNALSARDQQINEALQSRSVPLNEYQALMGGSQVTNPQFSGPQNNSVGAPNYLQALQNQYQGQLNAYNAQTSSNNSTMGGLFGLGGSLLGNSGLFGAGAGLGGGGVAADAFGMMLGL